MVVLCAELSSERPGHVVATIVGEHPGALAQPLEATPGGAPRVHALLPAVGDGDGDGEATLLAARRLAARLQRHGTVSLSSFYADPGELARAVQEAELVLDVLQRSHGSNGALAEEIRTGTTYRLLFRVLASHPEEVRAFYEDTVAPLVKYDGQYGTDLVGTLEAYLERNCNTNATAAAIYAHRHTVAYRLERVRELSGLDPGAVRGSRAPGARPQGLPDPRSAAAAVALRLALAYPGQMPAVAERLSADAYLARDDPRRTELLDGRLVVNEPTLLHQLTVTEILTAVKIWVAAAPGRGVVSLPLDVRLDDDNVLAPDVLWFAAPVPIDAVRAPRVPDLVVEVRSPSTWAHDLGPKRELYERHGVRELWLVDTAARSVIVFVRPPGAAEFADPVELGAQATLTSPLLPGFAAAVAALFPA